MTTLPCLIQTLKSNMDRFIVATAPYMSEELASLKSNMDRFIDPKNFKSAGNNYL